MSIKTKILMLKGESSSQATWGNISGTLSDQTDLNTALDGKVDTTDLSWGNISGTLSNQTDLKNELDSKVDASSIFDLIYPVGCYYWSSNSTNPGTLFGGTWEQIEDKFILAAGTTYSEGETGGEARHFLSLKEIPKHRHKTGPDYCKVYGGLTSDTGFATGTSPNSTMDLMSTEYAGGSAAHNNMPPYLVAYCWHRTA